MEILSAGEKIKKLRCDLGLKQDDITNEEVTKSLVSMIENNKRSLSWNTAKIVANCLNRYYANLGKEITPQYLMETEMDQARRIIGEEIEKLQPIIKANSVDEKLINRSIQKMVELANQWGLKKEVADLHVLRGEFYYYSFRYNSALKDYSHALEYYLEGKDYGEVARMYNFIGAAYHMMMLVDQAIIYYTKCYETAVEYETDNINRLKVESVYNLILCYRKINKYDMAIQQINIFKELKWDDPLFHFYNDNVMLVEANTYRDLKNHERAEKLYQRLLNKKERLEPNTLFLVYDNLTVLYREIGEIGKALEYIDMAFELKNRVELVYIANLYLQQAKCYMAIGESEKVLKILSNGLIIAEKVAMKDIVVELHFASVQMHLKLKDYYSALNHLQKVEKFILENNIKDKTSELNSFFIEVYFALEETNKCMEYVTRMRHDYLN